MAGEREEPGPLDWAAERIPPPIICSLAPPCRHIFSTLLQLRREGRIRNISCLTCPWRRCSTTTTTSSIWQLRLQPRGATRRFRASTIIGKWRILGHLRRRWLQRTGNSSIRFLEDRGKRFTGWARLCITDMWRTWSRVMAPRGAGGRFLLYFQLGRIELSG